MPNYNDNNTRDNSIDQLPRMTFQLPNTESGNALTTISPVFFCQAGCSVEYHFSNITSCQFNNDGKKFTITPTDTTNINYIMWNGTDVNSGEKMTQFTLKEIYFTAPAKDYIGTNSDILSQSIQYYFVFVNEKYSNLMICISIIGSVNNLGNAPKSNGFVMLETLSTRIPAVNVQSQLGNLNNFNLGTLIPPNKPFFNTLVTNNIQYIILTEVVDVPVEFFSNMTTIVNGGTQLYTSKMNQFKTNIPVNPPSTILFYNENSQTLDNQSLVCNSNCDLVPGKKITPTIGKYTTVKSDKKPEPKLKTISGTEIPLEECQTEEVWANQSLKTSPPTGDPTKPGTSIDDAPDNTAIVAITVSLIIIIVFCTILSFIKYTNKNKISIIFLVIGLIAYIVGLSVGCGIYSPTKNTNYWIAYVVGVVVWFISVIFMLKFRNNDGYSLSSSYPSIDLQNLTNSGKQQRYSGLNVPPDFTVPNKPWYKRMFSSNKPSFDGPRLTIPPSSSAATSSLVPQSSASATGPASSLKSASVSAIGPASASSLVSASGTSSTASKINATDFLKSKDRAINLVQRKLNTSTTQSEKNKMSGIIKKLQNNKITRKTFNEIVSNLQSI